MNPKDKHGPKKLFPLNIYIEFESIKSNILTTWGIKRDWFNLYQFSKVQCPSFFFPFFFEQACKLLLLLLDLFPFTTFLMGGRWAHWAYRHIYWRMLFHFCLVGFLKILPKLRSCIILYNIICVEEVSERNNDSMPPKYTTFHQKPMWQGGLSTTFFYFLKIN
jgi:hypothetical protein